MVAALSSFVPLVAPASWRAIDLISDLHLQPSEPLTYASWCRYMRDTPADAIFILGDLFEVWVGDDVASVPGFAKDCADVLRAAAHTRHVFFMHGNRDFLVGPGFLDLCRIEQLQDPTVLDSFGTRYLLTHGDALCLGDTDYMAFRAEVRQSSWRNAFLARPLAERQAIGRALREQSEARKNSSGPYADVDENAALTWLAAANAQVMIHGHTHQPATHAIGATRSRVVLSDWDASATPPRVEALRLSASGVERVTIASC